MKPLFWKPIQLRGPAAKSSVWDRLQEPQLSALEALDSLFARKPAKPVPEKKKEKEEEAPKPGGKSRPKVAKLIDPKRAQNLGIFISGNQISSATVREALVAFDSDALPYETLKLLQDYLPSTDELSIIRDHVTANPNAKLDRPEQFLFDLAEIPRYQDRLSCLLFLTEHAETVSGLEAKLNCLLFMCQSLEEAESVRNVLGLVLSLGNYMNGGTPRGQADGFGLDILAKLANVKASDNSNLLHFLVSQYIDLHCVDVMGDSVLAPVPEPSDVVRASEIEFSQLERDLETIQAKLKACEEKTSRVVEAEAGNEESLPFQQKMALFLEKSNKDLGALRESLAEAQNKYKSVLAYFCQPDTLLPKEFFSFWYPFCRDFKELWRREIAKRQRDKRRKAEEKLREIKKEKRASLGKIVPRKPGGLKDRLASRFGNFKS